MKRMLLLAVSVLLISSVTMADHIGIYSDATGESCSLGNIAGQFSQSATVIHKFATGATGSRFKVALPAGSAFFTFNTPYVLVGVVQSDGSLGYGNCLSGCIVLGNLIAIYGPGTLRIEAADLQANIFYTDCSLALHPATGGTASVNSVGSCEGSGGCTVAVESSTWGSVKSLYR